MTAPGFALFATALGRCGIAWGARGIRATQLPEANAAATRARLPRELLAIEGAALALADLPIAGVTRHA